MRTLDALVAEDQLEAPSRLVVRRPVVNLLDDLDGLAQRLAEALSEGDPLDSFLLAAGMNQITEDYLHRDVLMLSRVATNLHRLPARVGSLANRAVEWAHHAGHRARWSTPSESAALAWQRQVGTLTQVLADRLAGSSRHAESEIELAAAAVAGRLPALPLALRRTILRMPTCFQSLDQRTSDCSTLASRFAARWPDRARPVRVLGLRTSGSYLGPLVAAYLRQAGYRDVLAWTVRPGDDLYSHERQRLAALTRSEALLLVVDDPPKSGASLVKAVQWLERRGLSRHRIVMLVPLTGSAATLPQALVPYQVVVLPWSDWSVHSRLEPEPVRDALAQLLTGRVINIADTKLVEHAVRIGEVTAVERLQVPPIADLKSGSPARRHVRAVYELQLNDDSGRELKHRVYAKGVGQGYFGRHSLTVADKLAGLVPDTYGLWDGLLFRAWVPESSRLHRREVAPVVVNPMARYVLARQARLEVAADLSERMVGLNPVWQRVADVLAASFGHARSFVRPLTHAAARRLLRVRHPSVIDGSMSVAQWFRSGAPGLIKVDYDERAYSNQDTVVDQLYSFDAVFDLAGAAADLRLSCPEDGPMLAAALRRRFEANAGTVGAEKWLLYQLVVLKSYRQFIEAMRSEFEAGTFPELAAEARALLEPAVMEDEFRRVGRVMSSLDQEYWREALLGDVAAPVDGPVCVIDIDGVLETDRLGYSSVSRQGALAIRSLAAHDYRPILATGRSVDEVRDRCRALGLVAGIAEYGAAFYDLRTDSVRELLSTAQKQDLDRLRSVLVATKDVYVAAGHGRAVRASHMTAGESRPLPEAMVDSVLNDLGLVGKIRQIKGWAQTDFMVDGIDKAKGLTAWLDLGESVSRVAFAIGDTAEDLPVMRRAGLAVAPANAERPVRTAGVRVMRGRHQAGLAQGVRLLIGHRPGGCERCRPASLAREAAILVAALRAQEGGKVIKLRQAMQLALDVARA